ncbi:MAG: hypothetical protein ACI9NT_002902 [Bacteroidia bacterium]|jgi:hypothetical protein
MPARLTHYRGAFEPQLSLDDFEHSLLAAYGREVMLANHIHDRGALLQVTLQYGSKAQTDVACDEWMASSPIYNHRNRELLKMSGDDVGTALKGLQLDIGAPHNFLAFHYELISPEEGFFWTTTCGPYNHVRRMTRADPAMETQICHHMEDPTFDATVMAVNSRMRCRPIFRPPHGDVPPGGPCRWRVAIDHEIGLVEDNPILPLVQESLAAKFLFPDLVADDEGMADYAGDFQRDFKLEDLAHNVLARQCREFSLDVQLLNRACYTSIGERWGEDVMLPLLQEQWRAMAPITVQRLRHTFGIEETDMGAVLKIIQLNPFLPPQYLQLELQQLDESHGRVQLMDCDALHEPSPRGLVSLLTHHPDTPGFDAMAQAVNAKARVKRTDPTDGAAIAWDIIIDEAAEPAQLSEYAELVAGADLADLDNSVHVYRYD